MTLRTFILAAIAVLLAFATFNMWLFSLIDRSITAVEQRIVLRDAKTGSLLLNCTVPTKRRQK